VPWLAVIIIGASVGFLAGLFGKGGSAIATPLLHAAGVPAIVAVGAPLPATIPSTLAAALAYGRQGLADRGVLWWSVGFGVPATIAGALATRWIGGGPIVVVTEIVVAGLGIRFLTAPRASVEIVRDDEDHRLRLALVATVVGVVSGLLANSGGFLLAPLYIAVLRMPIKQAFATSLVVSAALAVPGTIVHWALGHIDWTLVAVFGAASIPLSFLGGRVAVRTRPERLERVYGAVLAVLGIGLLVTGH
jgi:uncharacterized membrane protein YfcA